MKLIIDKWLPNDYVFGDMYKETWLNHTDVTQQINLGFLIQCGITNSLVTLFKA
jgi:hypothetical protein